VETLLIFVGMAVVTFGTRYAGLAVLGRPGAGSAEAPGSRIVGRWLRYVPAAVLAALVVPPVLAPQGYLEVGLQAWALLAGAAIGWRTRNVLWTILGGMAVYWALRALGL
jgi:branched-subunit amino acid transport protein